MNKLSELKNIIANALDWHKSRIDCLAQLLIALMTVRSVSLPALSVAMGKKNQIDSREKRLYRFFAHFEVDFKSIGRWILKLFFSDNDRFYLAIDRTNWFWGKSPINIFMLSICYEGIAIPLVWKVLPKDGTSSGREQVALCQRVLEIVEKNQIEGLLADREFANQTLIAFLAEAHIPFYIRMKEDNRVCVGHKKWKKAGQLFSDLRPYEHRVFPMKLGVFGQKLWLTATKNERQERMIVVTNGRANTAISIYLRRWEIEFLFQALKSRGFRFEETHMTAPERIEKMVAVLAIAFVWAHRTGEWRAMKKPIKLKHILTQWRPHHTFFRYGMDLIRDAITGLTIQWKTLRKTFQFLDFASLGANL